MVEPPKANILKVLAGLTELKDASLKYLRRSLAMVVLPLLSENKG